MRKLAVDANILVRNATRRLITGVAEVSGYAVVVPATAGKSAKEVYRKVIAAQKAREVEYESMRQGEPAEGEEARRRLTEKLDNAEHGFAAWLESEPKVNSGMMETAESTQKTKDVASSLLLEEVVQDPKDERYGTGEDPQVLAEALEAGAQWVASDNLSTISIDAMNRWLEKQQLMGNYLEVPQPFILRPDEAVITLLRDSLPNLMGNPWTADTTQVALCAAICESTNEAQTLEMRVWNLGRFGSGTRKGGAPLTGGLTQQWVRKARFRMRRNRAAEVIGELERMREFFDTKRLERTRAAEDRRLTLERTGKTIPNSKQRNSAGRKSSIEP